MRDFLQALRAITLFFLWPLTTYATSTSIGSTLGSVTPADWVSVAILSTVSGLVALLHRVRKSFEAVALAQAGRPAPEDDAQLIDWRLFAACHMAGSLLVGFLVFLMCEAFEVNNYIEAAGIALASWRGAKLADKWADNFGDGIGDRIASVFGRSTPP